ncbi:hypothetical protein GCM10008908_31870 [Clostridium subterminale]|uniref:Bacteriocin n=1 Tax=Clostridium subterminale TaxID=1550 RepID=A0ABN1KVS2_CLOSU
MKKLNNNLGNKNTISDIMAVCRCTASCACTSGQFAYTSLLNDNRRLSNVTSTTSGPEPY